MTDHTDHEWPREIWAFAIDRTEYEVSGTYVTSEHATPPRWEGDEERERPVQRYVDADVYDSADRYWRERCEAQAARIAELEAENRRMEAGYQSCLAAKNNVIDGLSARITELEAAPAGKGTDHAGDFIGQRIQHVQRGTLYTVVGAAKLQSSRPLSDYAELTIYRGDDGLTWARPIDEMADGRFHPAPQEGE